MTTTTRTIIGKTTMNRMTGISWMGRMSRMIYLMKMPEKDLIL